MGPAVALLAPHRDDAALSAAASLDALCRRGVSTTIVTCFPCSSWAPRCGDHGDLDRVTQVRAAEDEAFRARLGGSLCCCDLDLLDLPDRRPGHDVFGRLDTDAFAADVAAVVAGIAGLARRHQLMLVPMGLGGHLDHGVVCAAALAVAGGDRIVFYEDVPYVFAVSDAQVEQAAQVLSQRLGATLARFDVVHDDPLRAWWDAIACYPSQFSRQDAAKMLTALAHRDGEHLWATAAARARLAAYVEIDPGL